MFRMNGMSRSHGCERVTMFRMNGQLFCSRQKLSTYIHVGNVTITWKFIVIHGSTALKRPSLSMGKSDDIKDIGTVMLLSRQEVIRKTKVGCYE